MPRKKPLQQWYRVRFCQLLNHYATENNLSPAALHAVLGYHQVTVYRWLKGSVTPRRGQLKEICRKLNWDEKKIFSQEALLEEVVHRKAFDLGYLSGRFKDLRPDDPVNAATYVMLAATTAFSYLTKCGFYGCLTIDNLLACTIRALDPKLHNVQIRIFGLFPDGIQVQLLSRKGVPQIAPRSLDEESLDYLLEVFDNYRKPEPE